MIFVSGVMLLSKDRQNLLKIISYDFIFVGIQVKDDRGNYDEGIWEFEFKRLERHSKKAVSPLLLLGYFRDILKIGDPTQGKFLFKEYYQVDSYA